MADTNTATSTSRVLIILAACNFVVGMSAFMLVGLITPLSDGLSISTSRAGATLTVYALSYAVFSPLLVSASGGMGRRRLLALGLSVLAIANVIAALAPNEAWVWGSRLLAAAGAGVVTPIAAAIAASLSAPENRGKALAGVFMGVTLAQVIGVPAGSWLGYTFGWRAAFWAVAVLALPMIALVWSRIPKGLPFQVVGLSDLGRLLINGPAMLAVLYTSTFLGAIFLLYTYLAPLLTETMGFGRDGVSFSLVIFGLGAVFGGLLGGVLTDRFGALRVLYGLCIVQAAVMPLFGLLPLGLPIFFMLLFFWSIMGWSFGAAQQVRLLALAPEQASVILAMNAAAIYVGSALGAALGGGVLNVASPSYLGPIAGLGAFMALGHLWVSTRVSRR
ncbi:MAG: MFS transporter [Pseudomonadota bacterium]